MKVKQFIASLLLGCFVGGAVAAPLELADGPLYLGVTAKPNVLLMLDNSGSMKIPMYRTGGGGLNNTRTGFDSSDSYSGIFDENASYRYNAAVPVNQTAYDGTSDAAYNLTVGGSVAVDTTKTGAFYPAACSAAADPTCWSGKYLNWLTARRIDATRQALVGGKVESRTAFPYGSYEGVSYAYKVVGQNEYEDRWWRARVSNSNQFSPIPDNSIVRIESPAHENGGLQQTLYDPYAKIVANLIAIRNAADIPIGEAGSVSGVREKDQGGADGGWITVPLSKTYANPIIIARPPTLAGGAPGVVRIRNVTATSFEITFQEWEYTDDNSHSAETISYVAAEAGVHTLKGGQKMVVGAVTTNAAITLANCSGAAPVDNSATVNFASSFAGANPVVIASSNTINDVVASTVRVSSITTNNFRVAQQREEDRANATPNSETIGYIAIQPGTITDAAIGTTMEIGTFTNINQGFSTVNFTNTFDDVPAFVANTTTLNELDPANIRMGNRTNQSVRIHVDEESSCDGVNHANEDVGYFAIDGGAEFNIALLKENLPTGLLHDISSDVRLGVSFYRFPLNKTGTHGIYNGVKTNGGTLRFKVPNNPFVKAPSASGGGGYRDLEGYITTPIDEVVDAVEHYPLVWGTTPLAENLWEVIQYFEQDNPAFTSSDAPTGFVKATDDSVADKKRDPYYYEEVNAKLWCAKSSVILFTDGEPYRDNGAPSIIKDYDDDSHPQDGSNHGDDLDDVAYWGFCNKGSTVGGCIGEANGTRDLRPDVDGGDDDAGQYLRVHTVAFGVNNNADGDPIIPQVLIDTANNAGGDALAARNGDELIDKLTEAFAAAALESSSASAAVNSGSLGNESVVYQSRFNSSDWSGQLLAFPIVQDAATGEVSIGSSTWDAGEKMPLPADRNIVTFDSNANAGVRFAVPGSVDALPATMFAQLGGNVTEQTDTLNYLRGDQSNEIGVDGGKNIFRARETVLGDLINSAPVLLQAPRSRYPNLWGSGAAENDKPYSAFRAANSSRQELILVGANDGMMHGFALNGVEKFAYIPSMVFDRLPELASNTYTHRFYVDGSPNIIDAFFNNNWHTVLTAGLRGGGQGVYALDLTNPNSFNTEAGAANKVLWEFDDNDDRDLGYTHSMQSTVRLNSGKWGVVFGNGYNNTVDNAGDGDASNDSATGNAVLYIVDVEDGSIIKKFDTGVGSADDPTGANRPNGLATPAVIDTNNDSIADYIYAGDLFGNLWKIDVSKDIADWDFGYKNGVDPKPLYTACATTSCSAPTANAQSITTQPQIIQHPVFGGYMIYFGTGKYIETTDNSAVGQTTQTFYAIWDKDPTSGLLVAFDRDDLLQQEILDEVSLSGGEFRVSSDYNIDWSIHNGWYMDLIETGSTNNYGERQVSNAVVRDERLIFTTLLPSADACGNGGDSWLMELDLYSGARLYTSPFDTNNDGDFDDSDLVTLTGPDGTELNAATSGTKSKIGITNSPNIVTDNANGFEYKLNSGSGGEKGTLDLVKGNLGVGVGGRQSWRQLEF